MKLLYAAALSLAPLTAAAAPPPSMTATVAGAGPKVRIRGVASGAGLDRMSFALWIATHRYFAFQAKPGRLAVSNRTAMLNTTSLDFTRADRNRDGHVSARELADVLMAKNPAA